MLWTDVRGSGNGRGGAGARVSAETRRRRETRHRKRTGDNQLARIRASFPDNRRTHPERDKLDDAAFSNKSGGGGGGPGDLTRDRCPLARVKVEPLDGARLGTVGHSVPVVLEMGHVRGTDRRSTPPPFSTHHSATVRFL